MLDGTMVIGYDVAGAVEAWTAKTRLRAAEQDRGVPAWVPGASWQMIDAALRAIQRTRCTLDADEARWLREADRVQLWRKLGMVSALDYCDRVLGLAPRTAKDRLRVARRLGELPGLERELRAGMSYSAVRELARVATPATEAAWIEQARGKDQREVEEMVAGHKPGDLPGDPPDPELRVTPFTLALTPRVWALMQAAIARIRAEAPGDLEDDAIAETMARAVLEGAGAGSAERPAYQLAVTVCSHCARAEQEVGGYRAAIGAATLEQVQCDCVDIGDISTGVPERAAQTIPPATRRLVWQRDGGRCQSPGCRSKASLEIHHIVRPADGGDHSPPNLSLRCFACHQAHHDGRITIGGTAPHALTFTRNVGPAPEPTLRDMGAPQAKQGGAVILDDARSALVALGWSRAVAREAVDSARECAAQGLEAVIRAALARCPRPTM